MKMYYKILFWFLLVAVFVEGIGIFYIHKRRVYPGMPTQLTKRHYRPVAILGIDFGENVDDSFKPGQHYLLKVFHTNGGEVAFGFSPVDVEKLNID